MSATLCMHVDGSQVSYDDLAKVPCPPATKTWFPVPHKDVVDVTLGRLAEAGYVVKTARYGLARHNQRLFATFDLDARVADGVSLAFGVRSSIDKSFPLAGVAGNRVFVCDNLAFSGELKCRHKHTSKGFANFQRRVQEIVAQLASFREAEGRRIDFMKGEAVSRPRARDLVIEMVRQDALPAKHIINVLDEFEHPSFEEFRSPTLWSLYNAFTHVLGPQAQSNPLEYAKRTQRMALLLTAGQTQHDVAV